MELTTFVSQIQCIDMNMDSQISKSLNFLNPDLVSAIIEASTLQEIEKGVEILKYGQYVKVVPIVINGLVKVYTRQEDKELLLYYIKPNESCIMSFAASLKNEQSIVFAKTEETSTILLLPVSQIPKWLKEFPDINSLFFQQYNLRYIELLDTINHLIFDKLDKRLYDYLKEKSTLTGQKQLKISHRQIANELGTAREVITRVMKKLESEGALKQTQNGIEIIAM